MTKINNSVSFGGNIRIKSYYKSFIGTYLDDIPTTKAQDQEIRNLVETLVKKDTRSDTFPSFIGKEKADKLYDLLGKIIGRPLRNVKNQKVIHYDGDYVTFGDREAKWCCGENMVISLKS